MKNTELKNSFIERVETHIGIVHKICNIYSRGAEEKKDLFQDIMLQLWRSYQKFRGRSEFSTWMYRVSLNTALYYVRKEKKHSDNQSLDDNNVSFQKYETDRSDLDEEVRLLLKAIDKLKKIDKAIIMLYLDRRSYEEISGITGFTRSNVSVKIVRIKKQLEGELRKSFN